MAARSVAKAKSTGKLRRSWIQQLLKTPEVPFAFALLVADAILVGLIIAYVPCKDQTPVLSLPNSSTLVLTYSNFFLLDEFQIQRLIGTPICHRWDFFLLY